MRAIVNEIVYCDHSRTGFSRDYHTSSLLPLQTAAKRSLPKLRISNSKRERGIVACLSGKNVMAGSDPVESTSNAEEVRLHIGLARRNLLVQLTCDACFRKTSCLINRTAYEKGIVSFQCRGCQVYHKYVDNLRLIVQYDLDEDQETDIN